MEGSAWSGSGVVEKSNSEETGDDGWEDVRGRLPSLPGLNLPFLIPSRPAGDVLRKRPPPSLADRRVARSDFLSYLDLCGGGSRVNLDDASRGATSISLRVDLLERPGAGLGVRSLTRRVRDDPGLAEMASRMIFF